MEDTQRFLAGLAPQKKKYRSQQKNQGDAGADHQADGKSSQISELRGKKGALRVVAAGLIFKPGAHVTKFGMQLSQGLAVQPQLAIEFHLRAAHLRLQLLERPRGHCTASHTADQAVQRTGRNRRQRAVGKRTQRESQ